MMLAMLLAAAAPAPTVVDADRAFARMAQDKGQWSAFRTTAAPDAIWFNPQPSKVADDLKNAKDPATAVAWWPTEAWQSCDGTSGVTTGYARWPDGHASRYTTIWQRQPDGGWKWVYDQGENVPAAVAPPRALRPLTASCAGRIQPAVFARDPASRQGVGGSVDNSLAYWWDVTRDGAHTLVVRLWDGRDHAAVHRRAIAAPAPKPAP